MSRIVSAAVLLLAVAGGAYAQPEDGLAPQPVPPEPPHIVQQRDILREMALDDQAAVLYGVLRANYALRIMLQHFLATWQEKTARDLCTDNLKQLCLAMILYALDHDDTFPQETWRRDLLYPFPYLGNTRHFICPDRPRQFLSGYAMNRQLVGRATATITRPYETVLLFETGRLHDPSPVGGPEDLPEGGVHDGGVNVGFVDGHVKWYPVEEARRLLAMPVD